jgi:sigma-B regulation protein RsbU (phosphoserine phosphatase)
VPARDPGGNFFNFIPTNSQKLVVVMGTFLVRGIQAALNLTTLRALIQALVIQNDSPKNLLLRLNPLLVSTFPQGQRVNLFCGMLDWIAQTFTYTQAGDLPGIWFQGTAGQRQLLENTTRTEMLPHPDLLYEMSETQIQLRPGDSLYFFNRGILRLQNKAGLTLSENDLVQLILSHLNLGARGLLTQVAAGIQTFVANPVPPEDMTMAVLKIVASPLENKIT